MSREIPFTEKNDFIQREAKSVHFEQDLKLFKKVFPEHGLIPELERKNSHVAQKLHERMLLTLLQAKSPEDILSARGAKPAAPKAPDAPEPKTGLYAKTWPEIRLLAKEFELSTYRKSRLELQAEIAALLKKKRLE